MAGSPNDHVRFSRTHVGRSSRLARMSREQNAKWLLGFVGGFNLTIEKAAPVPHLRRQALRQSGVAFFRHSTRVNCALARGSDRVLSSSADMTLRPFNIKGVLGNPSGQLPFCVEPASLKLTLASRGGVS